MYEIIILNRYPLTSYKYVNGMIKISRIEEDIKVDINIFFSSLNASNVTINIGLKKDKIIKGVNTFTISNEEVSSYR